MKILTLLIIVFFPISSVMAETVICRGGSDEEPGGKTKLKIALEYVPGHSERPTYLVAETKNSNLHVWHSNFVHIGRVGGKVVYRDIFREDSFTLVLESAEARGEGIDGEIFMSEAGILEFQIPVSCSITGELLQPLPRCGVSPNLDLISVAKFGTPAQLEAVLECGADPNFRDETGCRALNYVTNGACGYVSSPPSSDPSEPGNSAPPRGASRNLLVLNPLIEHLLRFGADLNVREPHTLRTPLMSLTGYGQRSAVDVLLDAGAEVNAQDFEGNTALMIAAAKGDEMIIRSLLWAKPDRELRNAEDMTAFEIAEEKGFFNLLPLLDTSLREVVVKGAPDGSCSPTMLHLMKGDPVKLILEATEERMFLFIASNLDLELMAMPGGRAELVFTPNERGMFPFTCGMHGAPDEQQTQGHIMVME